MKCGQLSEKDIKAEQEKQRGFQIVPYKENCLKGASYDISPTIIAMSVKVGMLETVYRDRIYLDNYYIFVKANDTVLVVSRDFLSLPSNISGYVVSRVSMVSSGLGHVSTNIDPNWKGALLIALSNPTNKPIKVYVGGKYKKPLATVSFHYLNSPCEQAYTGCMGMRYDLLEKNSYFNRHGVKAMFRKIVHPYRKEYTNFFFGYLKKIQLNGENWESIVPEIQGEVSNSGCINCKYFVRSDRKSKDCFADFIVTENVFLQAVHWIQKYWSIIKYIIAIFIAVLAIMGVIPDEWLINIKKFTDTMKMIN